MNIFFTFLLISAIIFQSHGHISIVLLVILRSTPYPNIICNQSFLLDQDINCLIEEIDQITPENSVIIYRAMHNPYKELSEFFYHNKMHFRQIECY